ncbi:MAG: Mut7-C RNAse domain-containing protein [Candidatus Nitrosotenuis sp.]
MKATYQKRAIPKLNQYRLVIDSMLGTIAKKLRILGFDCRYSATIDDEDILLAAKKEDRAIITKDRQLAINAKKHDILAVDISTYTEKDQMVEIAEKLSLGKYKLDVSNARCSMCNGNLNEIKKEQIADKIPLKTAQNTERFWICNDCKHIYWEGTHIRNLEKLIAEINEKL